MNEPVDRKRRTCSRCGGPSEVERCPACAGSPGGKGLRMLHRESPRGAPEPPPPVRLIREFKGPTVRELVEAEPAAIQLLPGRLLAMLKAVEDGRLAEADAELDGTFRSILHGPGYRCRSRAWSWIVWVWLGALGAAVALFAW